MIARARQPHQHRRDRRHAGPQHDPPCRPFHLVNLAGQHIGIGGAPRAHRVYPCARPSYWASSVSGSGEAYTTEGWNRCSHSPRYAFRPTHPPHQASHAHSSPSPLFHPCLKYPGGSCAARATGAKPPRAFFTAPPRGPPRWGGVRRPPLPIRRPKPAARVPEWQNGRSSPTHNPPRSAPAPSHRRPAPTSSRHSAGNRSGRAMNKGNNSLDHGGHLWRAFRPRWAHDTCG